MEEYISYLKKFQIAVLIVVLAFAGVVFLVMRTIPEIQNIMDNQANYKTQLDALAESERRMADVSANLEKEKEKDSQIEKAFFKPSAENMNSEAAISQEFEEILKLIRDNKIKTYTLKFEPDPGDDNFVKHVPEKFYVSKINTTLIATYTDFENFLRDLYKHEHFLDISSIEIKPYSKNKRILLIDLQLKLYAQRDPGVATDFRSAPAQVQENKESSDNKPEDKSNSSDNNAKG